ncbi:hypothetical protein HaLaN_09625 [Haematococcus lacustris]|uniref:Uncharacterized protein n=1 Tax=Haematococcus lacustris TaxID=44745 RepID=A0A699YVV4_HAELA|nr:hypothetical protein HaLaN_09625 [Haematococcus lacustris]
MVDAMWLNGHAVTGDAKDGHYSQPGHSSATALLLNKCDVHEASTWLQHYLLGNKGSVFCGGCYVTW